MKRTMGLLFVIAICLSLAGCGSSTAGGSASSAEQGEPELVTVFTSNGKEIVDIDVPFDPQRVAVLDLAALDLLDSWGLGDRVVGMPKASRITYLTDYNDNQTIANYGTLKEVDMEALMSSQPDIIFIGGRLAGEYDNLSEIAPVVYTTTDHEIGYMQSLKNNVMNIAAIFGAEEKAAQQLSAFDGRIDALSEAAAGKTAVIGMVTSANFNALGNKSTGSVIGKEIGFKNLADNVDSTHGDSSSFELLLKLNPDYIFVIDRDTAINAEGADAAQQVMENELVMKTDAYQNDRIVYLTPAVWYLSGGGIQATDVMLSDLEEGIEK